MDQGAGNFGADWLEDLCDHTVGFAQNFLSGGVASCTKVLGLLRLRAVRCVRRGVICEEIHQLDGFGCV